MSILVKSHESKLFVETKTDIFVQNVHLCILLQKIPDLKLIFFFSSLFL
jgi:hypothetical protein